MAGNFVDAQGTIVRVYASDGTTKKVVGNIDSIGTFAPGTRTERDRTTLASEAKEWGYGLKDNGIFAMNCFYDPDDEGQADLIAQEEPTEAEKRKWEVEFSNGELREFNAYLTDTPMEISKDTDVMKTYSVRISGAVQRTPAPSP